jgi:hypothetical protein
MASDFSVALMVRGLFNRPYISANAAILSRRRPLKIKMSKIYY